MYSQGCSFRCDYCYNKELKDFCTGRRSVEEFMCSLRTEMLDGVVVTGGEPTEHEDLADFLYQIREKGLEVKLDTNGSNPDLLRHLVADDLVDYVAIDVKNSPEKYQDYMIVHDVEQVGQSIEIIKSSGKEHEFRTTVARETHGTEDVAEIAKWVAGADRYYIQNIEKTELLDGFTRESRFTQQELEEMKAVAEREMGAVDVRNL